MENLSKIEYEGLALLGIRIIQAYEGPIRSAEEIRSRMIRADDGVAIEGGYYGGYYELEDFILDKLILQDNIPILIVYDTKCESDIPKYVDMTDYLGCFELDLDDLIVDLYKTRE